MAVIWTTQVYDQAYTRYNHQWAVDSGFAIYKNALTTLMSRSSYTPASEVLFVGCGFGYWMEYLLSQQGVQEGNVWGTDIGPHITPNKSSSIYVNQNHNGVNIASKILNLDITSPNILNDLKPYFGGNGKVSGWVISTLALTSLQTDQEISSFGAACDNIKGANAEVAHIFTSKLDPSVDDPDNYNSSFGMNWQDRDYWSSRLPNHWLIDQHGWGHPEAFVNGRPVYGVSYFGVWNPNANGPGQGGWQ